MPGDPHRIAQRVDQSGNSREAALRNISLNEVLERVELDTCDMTSLPYPDSSYDLVTASMSIHNLSTATMRGKALAEAWRVLKPGGRLMIVDIQRIREYEVALDALKPADMTRRNLGWRVWWSGPWMSTAVIQARKPTVP